MSRSERRAGSSRSYEPLLSDEPGPEISVDGVIEPTLIDTWSNAQHEPHARGDDVLNEKISPSSRKQAEMPSPRSSMEANEPLLSDSEDDGTLVEEEEKTPDESEEEKKSFSKAEYTIAFTHFLVSLCQVFLMNYSSMLQRIFSYSTWSDGLFLLGAATASICTGVTLPLMNVVFGMNSKSSIEFPSY